MVLGSVRLRRSLTSVAALVATCIFLATIPHTSGRILAADPKPPTSGISEQEWEARTSALEDASHPAPAQGSTEEATEEGDLRLVSRVDINGFATGVLQVFQDEAWGVVCSSGFTSAEAGVACRQLGFVGGAALPLVLGQGRGAVAVRSQEFQDAVAPVVLQDLNCTGTEKRLVDCPGTLEDDYLYSFSFEYTYIPDSRSLGCDPLQGTYAVVACGTEENAENGDLRLRDGRFSEDGTAQFGRLEVFNDGGWGTVCDRTGQDTSLDVDSAIFSATAANVACNQLGFKFGAKTAAVTSGSVEMDRRIPIWLAGAPCNGSESSLAACGAALGQGTDACGLRDNLALVCFNDPLTGQGRPRRGALRLAGVDPGRVAAIPDASYGRLEIFMNGFWSTVCDRNGFTPDSAKVACKALGWKGGVPVNFLQPYSAEFESEENEVLAADLPVGLSTVDCNGTESSLLECSFRSQDVRLCGIPNSNFTDATVLACGMDNTAADCEAKVNATPVEGSVRLRGGFGSPCDPIHSGFVEVYHFGEWGTICRDPDNADTLAADVVCRQLGFPHGTVVNPLALDPDGRFATGIASAPGPLGDLELLMDSSLFAPVGAAEVEEAEEPQERSWLRRVACRGTEGQLIECDLGAGFQNSLQCGTLGAALETAARLTVACRSFAIPEALEGVTTPGAEEGDVRLVDEVSVANWQLGRLEVFSKGQWGQVCARGFSAADARVACRQLGYAAGTIHPNATSRAVAPEDTLVFPEVSLTSPGCNGSEASLLECRGDVPRVRLEDNRECFGSTDEGLYVACVAQEETGEDGALRLTAAGGDFIGSAVTGVLEIFHAGAWGTVCENPDYVGHLGYESDFDPPLTNSAASIACRELGFERGAFRDVPDNLANVTRLPAWLGAVPCVGFEASITDCGIEFGSAAGCGATQQLTCIRGRADVERGTVRLVGGSADPGGTWEFGRLEVYDGDFFSSVSGRFGRRAADVACGSLGFSAGAQLLSGQFSALPGNTAEVDTISSISCSGGEATLGDCEFPSDPYSQDYANPDEAVALLCTNPSGCTVDAAAPAQGDVRLVPLSGSASTTAPCDNVHFGGVEIFNDGQWGKICNGVFSPRNADFTVAAQVVCRQLGFPFGGLYDVVEVGVSDYQDYSSQADVVWATRLECAGNEERLDDCFFPEDASLGRGASGDGSAESPASGSAGSPRSADVPEAGFAFESTAGSGTAASPTSDDAFAPALGPSSFFGDDDYATIYESFGAFEPDSAYAAGPSSDSGILFAQCSRRDSRIFGVVCRKFELEETPLV